MKKVLISGYYGFNNTGDEAILESLSNQFSKSGIEIEALSANPLKTQQSYGIKAYRRFNLPDIIKAIKNCDALISGGGSLFQDATSSASFYYYLGIVVIAQMLCKKVLVFSQGIGPLKKDYNRKVFTKIINKIKMISVRDEISIKELETLKIYKPEIIVTTDPVFMLESAPEEVGKNILKESGVNFGSKLIVGIAARDWTNNKEAILQIAETADGIIEEFDAQVVLFPFHYPEDLDFANGIAEKMRSKPCILKGEYKPSEIMSAIGLMDINIGVRLHALIFSVCMGVPVIGITYDPKIDGFLNTMGLKPICRYDNIQREQIIKEIQRIINNRDEIVKAIAETRDSAKQKSFENLEKLMEVVENG